LKAFNSSVDFREAVNSAKGPTTGEKEIQKNHFVTNVYDLQFQALKTPKVLYQKKAHTSLSEDSKKQDSRVLFPSTNVGVQPFDTSQRSRNYLQVHFDRESCNTVDSQLNVKNRTISPSRGNRSER
jgi:hypothetical protein